MIPFILPNLYNRLHRLPKTDLAEDANYYDFMEDIWLHCEPAYEAFYAWARQRCEGDVTDLGAGNGNAGKKLNAKHYYDYIQSFPECQKIDLNKPLTETLLGDTFILSHVLEHLTDPKQSLKYLWNKLDSGDRLIICVPDATRVNNTAIPFHQYIPTNNMKAKHYHHVYAWTPADLYNTLIQDGWDNIDIAYADVCDFACIWALAVKP